MINKFPTTAIFLLIGLCLISSSTIVFAAKVLTKEGQVENEKNQPKEEKKDKKSGYDLTIIIKLNYPKLADTKPDLFKKVRLDINDINGSDSFQKYYNLSEKPGSIKVKHLEIPTGYSFNVCLNNPNTDDGECVNGHNGKGKAPESVSLIVP